MSSNRLWTRREWEEKSDEKSPHRLSVTTALQEVYNATDIYSRFDALTTLTEACQSLIAKEEKTKSAEAAKTLQSISTQFAIQIVNATDEKDLSEKTMLRKRYKKN